MTNIGEEKKDLVIHKPSALSYKDRSPRLEPERRVEQRVVEGVPEVGGREPPWLGSKSRTQPL